MLMMNCSILGSDALTNMALYIHNASTCLVAAIVFFFYFLLLPCYSYSL